MTITEPTHVGKAVIDLPPSPSQVSVGLSSVIPSSFPDFVPPVSGKKENDTDGHQDKGLILSQSCNGRYHIADTHEKGGPTNPIAKFDLCITMEDRHGKVMWPEVVMAFEIKTSLKNNRLRLDCSGQVIDRLVHILMQQPHRTFVLGAALDCSYIEVFRVIKSPMTIYRSGLLSLLPGSSSPIPPGYVLLYQLLHSSPQSLGFIPPCIPEAFRIGSSVPELRLFREGIGHHCSIYKGTSGPESYAFKVGPPENPQLRAEIKIYQQLQSHISPPRGIPVLHFAGPHPTHPGISVLVVSPFGKTFAKSPPPHLLHSLSAIGRLLAWLHERGYVHRDIGPANIIFSRGIPHLIDYGITCKIKKKYLLYSQLWLHRGKPCHTGGARCFQSRLALPRRSVRPE
eukprot:gnl/Trimastix_PCT/209.p1 GENE.gnl/Trimastix_PCT/209~~gnl/Trimastix_PCT/209.p1  ORF type:complete len:442 (-),score=-18.05 gnl/Trimastix_PCT/209:116-1309(-)